MCNKRQVQRLEGRPGNSGAIAERIPVPAPIYAWKASDADRQQALAVQLENRERFHNAFARGLAVVGYTRDEHGNGTFELAEPPWPDLEIDP